MKLALVLGGIILMAPGLVACGSGGDDQPEGKAADDAKTVSVEDFCTAAEKFENTFSELDTSDLASSVATFKSAAQEFEDAGTPQDTPDDAREGLTLTLDKITGLPDDASEDDMNALFQFTEDEKAKSMAFESYLDDTCDYRTSTP